METETETESIKVMQNEGLGPVNVEGMAPRETWASFLRLGKTGNDPKRFQHKQIVVVDDDECARSALSMLIESRGYRAATFASAEQYLASNMRDSTAYLILDVHLLGMSGPDLHAHLIAAGCCPPTIFVTGRCEEQVRKRVIEAGALAYLNKPCSEKTLFDCFDEALCATR